MSTKQRYAQESDVDAIIGDVTEEIEVDGHTLALEIPAEREVFKMERALANCMTVKLDKDGNKEEVSFDEAKFAEVLPAMSIDAIQACMSGLPRRKAFLLLRKTGGHNGKLAVRCRQLCGAGDEVAEAISEGDSPEGENFTE